MRTNFINFGTVCAVALVLGAAGQAHATPYAYASNQITGLTLRVGSGATFTPSSATTSISDSAQFNGFAPAAHQTLGTVGTAITIDQAYSGPGPAPAATYGAIGAGNFVGARANATIGGGLASAGGATVSNVAEASGNELSNSAATNNASINFSVVGTGSALTVSFNDLYGLTASTDALARETASASIQNNFSITADGATSPLFSTAPAAINRQISSIGGVPTSSQVGPTSVAISFSTPTLVLGQVYNIALTSTASQSIQPGVAMPEPASLGLLGAGFMLIGLVRKIRAR